MYTWARNFVVRPRRDESPKYLQIRLVRPRTAPPQDLSDRLLLCIPIGKTMSWKITQSGDAVLQTTEGWKSLQPDLLPLPPAFWSESQWISLCMQVFHIENQVFCIETDRFPLIWQSPRGVCSERLLVVGCRSDSDDPHDPRGTPAHSRANQNGCNTVHHNVIQWACQPASIARLVHGGNESILQ